MRSRTTASLAYFAAICGILVASSTATAQLRCANAEVDTLIRTVSFEGNQSFSDEELAFHVVSTPSDRTRRYLGNSKLVIGSAAAAGLAFGIWKEEALNKDAAIWGIAGLGVGLGVSRISGVARCLRPGTLAGDILNLSGYYRDEGFIDVRVDTVTRTEGRWVDVTFRVTEGQPVLVDSVAIIGFDTVALGRIPANLNSRKGGRYSPTLTQEDIDTLETRLHDHGYPEGRVDREVKFISTYRTSVEFTVTSGPRAKIGTITINPTALEGRQPTIDTSVIRTLLRFRSGDLYSERVLFEGQRRFYRVGTFLSAEVAPDLRRLQTDSVVDVIVNVTEDLTHSGSVEPGIGTLDCLRLRGSYTDKAFRHGINRLDLTGAVSKIGLAPPTNGKGLYDACRWLRNLPDDEDEISIRQLNYSATVSLSRPIPLPGGLLPSVSAYTERRGGYRAYLRTTLIGGAVTMSKAITRTIAFEGSYNLEYGYTEAAETVLCFLFRACDESARQQLTKGDKPLALAVVGAKFSRDRRNSADSASSGTFVRLDLRMSNRFLLSDTTLEFRKGVVDAAWYHRFGPGVIALRARAGLIGGGRKTEDGVRLPPPQERLYVGGENSVRGFRQNELGPLIYVTSDDSLRALAAINAAGDAERRDSLQSLTMRIIPAGGNEMYIGNFEYRLPGPFLKSLQTVLFLDVGALSTPGITTVTGSGQFRFTPGIALKYFSPVGPVQINVGYNRYDLLSGPAFSDQFTDALGQPVLRCVSGTEGTGPTAVCKPIQAIAPLPRNLFRRLTLSVAFPPDF